MKRSEPITAREQGGLAVNLQRELQALLLELGRERNRLREEIEQLESGDGLAPYERGKSFGLSFAANRIEALVRKSEDARPTKTKESQR